MKRAVQQTSILGRETPSLGSIKTQIDHLSEDNSAKSGLRLGFLSLGACLLILALTWHRLPPEIPLLYSHSYGPQRLVEAWQIWLLPASALTFEMIAVRMAGAVIRHDKLLAQVLVWSAATISLMILIAVIKTVLLIT